MPQATLVSFPCPQAFRRLAQRPSLFRFGDSRSDSPDDRKRDLVLHGEHIGQIAVVAFCPHVVAGLGVYELCGRTDPLTAATHAALQDVAYAEFVPDLFHVDRATLVAEARIAGDDKQRAVT